MNSIEQILSFLDDSMYHEDESVSSALDGVTNQESEWQHPAYSIEEHWPGMPAPGTIAWHVAHLLHSARHYATIIKKRPVQTEPKTPPPNVDDFTELISELHDAHEELKQVISRIPISDLSEDCTRGMSLIEFIRMVIRHNSWHAGQIRVIKRLVRQKNR